MDIADALSGLADIHLPGQIGLWPLAPGWWLLIALLLALAVYGGWILNKRFQLQRRLGGAVSELGKARAALKTAGEDDMSQRLIYVNEVNAVLRRVAILHLDPNQVAGLSGQAWIEFLREHDKAGLLTPELAQVLSQGRFAPRCDVNADALERMASAWIKNLYMAKIEKNSATAEYHA